MTQLEECLAQKEKLTARMREYKDQLARADSAQDRALLKAKVTAYRSALRDLQVQIDHLDPPKECKTRKAQRKRLDIGALTWDWFEYSGETWSDIEGHSWQQVEARDFVEFGTSMAQLQEWLAEGSRRLTERQRLYIDAYYNQGMSMKLIAETYGVDKSTVARSIKRGLSRMQMWIEAKRLIADHMSENGKFEWERCLNQLPSLTDRQKKLFVLSRICTQKKLAEKLGVDASTISRTVKRAENKLRLLMGPPAFSVQVKRRRTCHADS